MQRCLATAEPASDRAALPCYYIPLLENRRFVGRDRTLATLKEMLFVSKEWRKAAIVGLGGVGKTQVALQLAYWSKKHHPEFSIFWVPALSKATFEQAFTAIARKLSIQGGDEGDDLNKSVRRYLSSNAAGPWLLVVDNADDGDILFGSADTGGGISEYLPESDNGITLFTTRSREVAVSVTGSDVIELHEMDPPEAAEFLEKSLIQKDGLRDVNATADLLKELTYLPLAITQAAAYINIKQVPLAEYVGLLHGTQQSIISLMSKEFRDNTRYPGSHNAVATTWLVSFDQIRKSDNAAADLLSFISCIEPKGIPQSLLPDCGSREQLIDAIGTLCAYAFLTRRGASSVFDMHSLVHLATRIWVQRGGLTTTTDEKATRHIAKAFPSSHYTNRELWRECLPHAFRVLECSKELDINERCSLLLCVGRCLRMDGRIKEARKTLEEAFQWTNRHLAEDNLQRLMVQRYLAQAYRDDGQLKDGIVLLEQVVAIRAKTLAEDNHERLQLQRLLAEAYREDGQVIKAVAMLERTVAIGKRTLTENDEERLHSQQSLAAAYYSSNQVKEAIALLEPVVAIRKLILAEDDPTLLVSQGTLALAYLFDGRAQDAIALLEHVVAIEARTLSEDHLQRLITLHALALAYRRNDQAKKAVILLEHVVAIEAQTLAEEHPTRLQSQRALAVYYVANGQPKKALALLEHVFAIRKRTLDEDHPLRLASQEALAISYEANGQPKKAVALLEHVVAIQKRTLDEDHPGRLRSERRLAGYVADALEDV